MPESQTRPLLEDFLTQPMLQLQPLAPVDAACQIGELQGTLPWPLVPNGLDNELFRNQPVPPHVHEGEGLHCHRSLPAIAQALVEHGQQRDALDHCFDRGGSLAYGLDGLLGEMLSDVCRDPWRVRREGSNHHQAVGLASRFDVENLVQVQAPSDDGALRLCTESRVTARGRSDRDAYGFKPAGRLDNAC